MMVWSKAALGVSHTWVMTMIMTMMMTMIVPKNTTNISGKVLAEIFNFWPKCLKFVSNKIL